MRIQSIHKMFLLGFVISFMNFGNVCAKALDSSSHFSKNTSSNIHCFAYKTTFDATPLIVETVLEYDDSQISQQNAPSLDNLIQPYDLFFGYKNYLPQKISIFYYLLYFPVKRYLLNYIFLI